MPNSIGRGIEWCDQVYEWRGILGDMVRYRDECCPCEIPGFSQPETKCPDLGDWSDTPHDEFDSSEWFVRIQYHNPRIAIDRERLLSYIED
jgi:hypothetical protein